MKYLRPIAFVVSIILFFLFMNFEVYLHKSLWNLAVPLRLGMVVLALFLAVVFIKDVWTWAGNSFKASVTQGVFMFYVLAFIVLMIVNPFGFPFQPKVKYAGIWQGSGSAGKIILYNDKIFEIYWNGLLRGGRYLGQWTQRKDTFYLTYSGRELDRVGNKLFYDHVNIIPVDGVSGLLLRQVKFKRIE